MSVLVSSSLSDCTPISNIKECFLNEVYEAGFDRFIDSGFLSASDNPLIPLLLWNAVSLMLPKPYLEYGELTLV